MYLSTKLLSKKLINAYIDPLFLRLNKTNLNTYIYTYWLKLIKYGCPTLVIPTWITLHWLRHGSDITTWNGLRYHYFFKRRNFLRSRSIRAISFSLVIVRPWVCSAPPSWPVSRSWIAKDILVVENIAATTKTFLSLWLCLILPDVR